MLTALRRYAAGRPRGFFLVLVTLIGVSVATPFVVHTVRSGGGVHVEVLGKEFTAPSDDGLSSQSGKDNGNSGGDRLTFTLSATVSGLRPGSQQVLPVVVTNPKKNNGTLTVNTIVVSAGDVMTGNTVTCAGSNLVVRPYNSSSPDAASYVIARDASKTVPLSVLFNDLRTVNQTSCRGTAIPLTINGTATVSR